MLDKEWRDLLYELAEKFPQNEFMNFTLELCKDKVDHVDVGVGAGVGVGVGVGVNVDTLVWVWICGLFVCEGGMGDTYLGCLHFFLSGVGVQVCGLFVYKHTHILIYIYIYICFRWDWRRRRQVQKQRRAISRFLMTSLRMRSQIC